MKIKICGIRTIEDVKIVNEFIPDYIGFIFVSDRKRYITPDAALVLKNNLDKRIKAVGVFIKEDINIIKDIVDKKIIDVIQLHGHEDDEYVKEVKKLGLPVILAYRDSNYADYTLLDGSVPGSGKVIDWSKINTNKEFFLAGGLEIDNIEEAKKLKPYAVDVSSGVEIDGHKDYHLVKEFIRKCRA